MKCMSCGTEMNSTIGGNYTCPKCGQSVNDGVYRSPTSNTYGEPYLGWGQMGWICPKCGKVLAPWRAECDCHKRNTVTTDKSNINSINTGTYINNSTLTPDVKYTTATNVNENNEFISAEDKLQEDANNTFEKAFHIQEQNIKDWLPITVFNYEIKTEAYKEFAEKLKEFMHNKFKDLDEYEFEYITERDINNLLKETVGDDND